MDTAMLAVGSGGLARETARPNKGTPMSGGTIILLVSACFLVILMSSLFRRRSQPGDQGNGTPESGPPHWYGGSDGGSDSDDGADGD